MQLTYTDEANQKVSVDLTEDTIIIGRSNTSDISFSSDEKISRQHCSLRKWDDQYYLKDLSSKNGTFLNGECITDIEHLHAGDIVRIGAQKLMFDVKLGKGCETILHEVEDEMLHGKGYNTILREIVDETSD